MLSNCDPMGLHIAVRLLSVYELNLVRVTWAQTVSRHRNRSRLDRLRRLPERIREELADLEIRRLTRGVSRALFGSDAPPVPPHIDLAAREVNRSRGRTVLSETDCDLLVVSGAPILKPKVLALPKWGVVNVHYGIAPAYRGSNTVYWALRRRDVDGLGVTLHWMSSGLDAGPVLAYGFPKTQPGDTEVSILAGCARLAGELLLELLAKPQVAQLQGSPQAQVGEMFRERDRKLVHFVIDLVRRPRAPGRPRHIIRYF